MADEEDAVSEEESEEGEDEAEGEVEPEAPEQPKKKYEEEVPRPDESEAREEAKLRKPQPAAEKEEPQQMTEAEKAMLAAKKRHAEEEAAKLLDYEERRKLEKEQLEKELEKLRQNKERRMREWEEEEQQMVEQARIANEHRRKEEEEMRARSEAERKKRDEDRKKRLAAVAGSLAGAHVKPGSGRNFVIPKREKADSTGPIGPSKGPSKEELEAAKKAFVSALMRRKMDPSALLANDLKIQIRNIHKQICKLEAEKYDLEKRQQSQEYDLKELHEREKQAARNKAIKKGLDPNEAMESPYPPKINVASKHDRQVDRRSYGDRRNLYENPVRPKPPKVAHGTPRPPPDWGRCANEELEILRKNLEPPKYIEEVPIEGAKPPVKFIPLRLPGDDDEPEQAGGEIDEKEAKLEKGARSKDAKRGAAGDKSITETTVDQLTTKGRVESGAYTFRPGK